MGYIALALIGALLLVLLFRAFLTTPPAQLASGLKWAALIAGGALFIFLAATERLAPALALLGALLTFFLRAGAAWRMWQGAHSMLGSIGGGASSWGPQSRQSEVETAFLRMTLDHGSGLMEGTVRRGRFAGRRLAELSRGELVALCREARLEDEPSVALLEAYLDRRFPNWREEPDEPGPDKAAPRSGAMTPDEAWQILGLKPGASPAAVKEAHHRLMQRVHPDAGGSDWLAARINLARDLLLNR
jgi:hypothetical protein